MNAQPHTQMLTAIHWVRDELERAITRARAAIDHYAEYGGDPLQLQQAHQELSQVRGSATLIRCHGLAAVASEMAQALTDLIQGRISEPEPLYSALLGASIQLTDYVQALADGMPDCVLVMQPAINELRLSRGQPVLTESELFVAQMQATGATLTPEASAPEGDSIELLARRYLPVFEASLLSWIRDGVDAQTSAARAGKIAEQLAQRATLAPVHQLWRVAAAAMEAYLARGLGSALELKRLFGRLSAPLKTLAESGEAEAAARSGELSLPLLFMVGRSTTRGARVSAIRAQFGLDDLLPEQARVEQLRRRIHGPSTALLGKVSDEIRADFSRIKDQIDLAVRTGGHADLTATVDGLRHVADILGALGLSQLRQIVSRQGELLKESAQRPADPALWMELATSILRVESSLEGALFRQMHRADAIAGTEDTVSDAIPEPRDLAQGREALYREFLVNLARIKTALDAYFKHVTDEIPAPNAWFNEIASGFAVLDQVRAADLVRRLQKVIAGDAIARLREQSGPAEHFADAVAAIEYYIEAARAGAPGADAILDRLDVAIDAVEAVPAVEIADTSVADVTETVVDEATTIDEAPAVEDAADLPEPAAEPTPAPAAVMAAGDDDPEIREIFLEEADEVRATLQSAYAKWHRDNRDNEALSVLRRAFHTLKGSGRTVGAQAIGEFGWALENLLNKCLDGSLPVSSGIVETVGAAVSVLPSLIESFRQREPAPDAAATLAQRATDYAEGRNPDAGSEPDIAAVFREDATEKLATVFSWLDSAAYSTDLGIDRDAVRAFHTIRGAARVVDAHAVSELAAALEAYLDACDVAGLRLSGESLACVSEATATLRDWIGDVGNGAPLAHDAAPWLERIGRLQSDVPEDAVQVSADRQLAEVFAVEAFELVDKIESQLREWSQAPNNQRAAGELKVICHTLAGAALMSQCPAIGAPAKALQRQFDAAAAAAIVPSPEQFSVLLGFCETLFQALDAYREGRHGDSGEQLTADIDALGWAARAAVVADNVVPASPAPEIADSVVQSLDQTEFELQSEANVAEPISGPDSGLVATESQIEPVEAPAQVAAAEDIIEMPPVAADDQSELESEAVAGLEQALDGDGVDVQSMSMDAAPLLADEPDAELLAIFQAECEELLEGLDQSTAAFERNPADVGALAEIKRLLHTLKGSARVSGLSTLGEVAHQLESLFEQAEAGTIPAQTQFFARVQNAVDGLHLALDDLKRGLIPDLSQLLEELAQPLASDQVVELPRSALEADIDTGSSAAVLTEVPDAELQAESLGSDAPIELVESIEMIEPVTEAGFGIPEPVATPAQERPPVSRPPAAAPVATSASGADALGLDEELVRTFAGEAEELMEELERALPRWQALPGDYTPARDLLRALHTFKGGARMAGLRAMGDAAHELESLIEGLEYAGELNVDALNVVAGAVSGLRRMTDRLERGDYAVLVTGEHEDEQEEASFEELQALADSESLPPGGARVVTVDEIVADDRAAETMPDVPTPFDATPIATWDPALFWRPDDAEAGLLQQRRETARVPVEALDKMLNEAGEISIYRSRLEEHNSGIEAQLDDLSQAISRVRDQLRQLDIETEAQIAARGLNQMESEREGAGEFDPLEMDRYTRMQELSRALSESVSDLSAVHASLDQLASEATTILLQQGRINTEVQQGLMRTLMVPFSRQIARLQRVVQQTSQENGKRVELVFDGAEAELDRNVLERMTAPLEHLLRNAVIHGIESPQQRDSVGKPATGRIAVSLWREGSQLLIELSDDGRGLDLQAIRQTAVRRGLMPEDVEIGDDEAAQYIFMPGFSTARALTQDAGRGVGMDVVASEVKQLGGTLELASEWGKGARFTVRLPLTLAISQSLLVGAGNESYAIPLPSITGITRFARDQLDALLADDSPGLDYGGHSYRLMHLADLVGVPRDSGTEQKTLHAILVRMPESFGGEQRRVAVVVDTLVGSREIVSKAVGPQISAIPGISGATILADGRVVLILDVPALVQDHARRILRMQAAPQVAGPAQAPEEAKRELIMVVDDSITIRRVTERLLLKQGYDVITAKDGLDAMAQLQTERPLAILLDIEMPRANGFEVATFVRNTPVIANTPIIMITSRSGEKHREHAAAIGVERYLIKPFQEDQLLEQLREVIAGAAA
ncbi:response regulator [Sinimarinibacterium sp. CAU 1509]|uniref:hybrid sensor histidine kinase/response regulator n=1 Tax=Sinimarinibacterium sp. CAU 1509 TaxID=2562283 RepID=UPI0010AD1392|nr:Hpt domain-containing protein [Sinimarinibacterium sp. CAU 1509]TJY62003.1 response regulator [Sinimarinibacterium sp. CAU 1509]